MFESVHLCLSDLIDQDLTSYEYFHSLPADVRQQVEESDVRTFSELQACADEYRQNR